MSDINNLGGNQYDQSMDTEDSNIFLAMLYRNVTNAKTRREIIKLYFGEEDDNNIGDC